MKKFILKICGIVCLTLGVTIALSSLVPYNEDGYNRAFFSKRERLRNPDRDPALILVGGSNIAFGFNSEIIEDSLCIPVLNNGLHSQVGLKLMLDELVPYLIPGDQLVLSPEYEHFFDDQAYGGQAMTDLFYLDPVLGKTFSPQQIKTVVLNTPGYFKSKIEYYLVSVLYEDYETIYKHSGFNKYGDLVLHWNLPARNYAQKKIGKIGKINPVVMAYYKDKLNEIEEKGVKVHLIPPAMSETSFQVLKSEIDYLQKELDQRGIHFMVSPDETTFADTLFFDSHYHLGQQGACMRSEQVIRLLKSKVSGDYQAHLSSQKKK